MFHLRLGLGLDLRFCFLGLSLVCSGFRLGSTGVCIAVTGGGVVDMTTTWLDDTGIKMGVRYG